VKGRYVLGLALVVLAVAAPALVATLLEVTLTAFRDGLLSTIR
jgi:hypothetical protein